MKKYCKLVLLIILILINLSVFSQKKEVLSWLSQNAVQIKTTKTEKGLDDLMLLKEIIKDKRIVALGEATHGTKEIFEMKNRMLEFLVKEMGFRNFAIEANFTEALVVNDYVMYGRGDPYKALAGLYFWTWDTREVMAMIQWMKNYNKDKADKDKVKFFGFDMQVPQIAAIEVQKYLMLYDSLFVAEYTDFFQAVDKLSEVPDAKLPSYYEEKFGKPIISIAHKLEKEKEKFVLKTGAQQYAIARRNLEIVAQYFKMTMAKPENMSTVRDSCMSENVKWLLDFEGSDSKFVLWAHNGHIARNSVDYDGLTMGYYLSNFYKDNYYAIGFDFYKGSFQAVDMGKGLVEFNYTLNKNSTGFLFSQVNKKIFFFDFKNALPNKDMSSFLNDTMPSICIGSVFSYKDHESFYIKKPLAHIYDGLIFIRNTSRAIPNSPVKKNKTKNKKNDFGNLMLSLDAAKYTGKEFRFSAYVKMGNKNKTGAGYLWFRVDNSDKTFGFFDNMSNRPITSKEWNRYEISGSIDDSASKINFGCFLMGKGQLFIDNIALEYKEKNQWLPIELPDPTFENGNVNETPDIWIIRNEKYKIQLTDKTSYEGKKCVVFKR